jgi:hypothetical protein
MLRKTAMTSASLRDLCTASGLFSSLWRLRLRSRHSREQLLHNFAAGFLANLVNLLDLNISVLLRIFLSFLVA